MEYPNNQPTDSPTMPTNYLKRNKLLAAILIPLSLIVIFITGASILGQLFAAPKLIADEVPLWARILVELFGFIGAIAGLISALIAIMSSLGVNKFFTAGNQDAAVAASEKAQKYGGNLLLMIGILSLLFVIKIVQAFFLGK